MWKPTTALLLAVLVIAPLAEPQAATTEFDIVFKGKIRPPTDVMPMRVIARGTMLWNRDTGELSFEARGFGGSFEGSGTMVVTERGNKVWGLTDIEFADQEGAIGQAIFEGRLSRSGDRFCGRVIAASPTHLGPNPLVDFTLTKGRVKASLAD